MAQKENLNISFNGNASGIKKAAAEAADAVAGAFGGSGRQVRQFTDGIRSLVRELGTVGTEGRTALQALGTAFKALSATVGSLALTAVIGAFKQLTSEADRFRKTVEGIDMTNIGNAYRDTFRQSLSDQSGLSEDLARLMDRVRTGVSKGWAATTNFIFGNKGDLKEAEALADRAREIAADLNRIRAEERDTALRIAEYNVRIAEAQERARDVSLSMEERQKALETLQGAIQEKYALQVDLQERKLELTREMNGLVKSSEQDLVTQNQLEVQLIELNARKSQEMRSTLEIQNQFVRMKEKELEQERLIAQMRQSMAASPLASLGSVSGGGAVSLAGDSGLAGMDAQTERWQSIADAQREAIANQKEYNDQLNAAFQSMSTNALSGFAAQVGELAGNLINGSDAWKQFGKSSISAFADLAISAGEIVLGIGMGVLAVDAALSSLNAYAAIAAGAALIALGTMAKVSLANVARGASGSSSASVASSNYTSRESLSRDSMLYETMTVKVTGKLEAEGSKLVAVLNNENNRLAYVGA